MVGGAISGYCATGSRKKATPPRMTKTIDTTEAKIGRSIKKCEIRMRSRRRLFRRLRRASRRRRVRRLGRPQLGSNLLIWPRLHQSAHHDPVIRTDALLDDAQVVGGELTDRDISLTRYILSIDDHDISARLLGRNGSI